MRPHIKKITLVWRQGRSHSRIPVATIKSNVSGTTFAYDKRGVEEACKLGFVCFPEFPDTEKKYSTNVLKILAQRINDRERSDIQSYYDFWEIPEKARLDSYRMLAYTQGILPTDNFEFLAEYYGLKGVHFVSEISGLSHHQLDNDSIKVGDVLQWKKEPGNEHDPYAVALYKDGVKLSYVKKIHSRVFYLKRSYRLTVTVKKIEHNGHISKAYIVIDAKEA